MKNVNLESSNKVHALVIGILVLLSSTLTLAILWQAQIIANQRAMIKALENFIQ